MPATQPILAVLSPPAGQAGPATLGALAMAAPTLATDAAWPAVAAALAEAPAAPLLAVLAADGRPVGAIGRATLAALAHVEAPARPPLAALLDPAIPRLDAALPASDALAALAARPGAPGVLVTAGGRYRGVAPLSALLAPRRAHDELAEALRRTLDGLPFPLVAVRLDTGLFSFVNRRAAAFFGLPRGDAVPRYAADFYADFSHRGDFMRQLRERGRVDDLAAALRRTDGEIVWALISGVLTAWDGEASVIVSFNDITERKRAEE
ncbi:MAG TPA: PAS domain S-box protein, partial [Alphaproteobacteria bacterium]|nr:PAS domain S-box protein [Alphaproteobacteria bacterium]